jgi:hypothetical protein
MTYPYTRILFVEAMAGRLRHHWTAVRRSFAVLQTVDNETVDATGEMLVSFESALNK